MKTMNVLKTALTILVITFVTSCSKDDENTPADSRDVKYEVTGNATGDFTISYVNGSNSGSGASTTSLPWTKDIVAQPTTYGFAATMTVVVIGATPGKTITAKIYVGGVVKKVQTETVQANGIATISSLQYVLK